MIFPNSLAVAFVAFAGVNAGPCRPSSSDTTNEATTTITSNLESTTKANTFILDTTETTTATSAHSDESTTTILTVTETSAATESDTTTLFTTTSQDLPTTVTTTTAAMTTSEAPETPAPQCADLANPYVADDGTGYELRCNWRFDGYADLEYYTDSTMEKCIKACGQNGDCNYAQFETEYSLCILIGTGFDYSSNSPGFAVAVKQRPN
ncbi:uncharacterized protein BKA55DRAFT_562370 [Fusarium redolens]|uniref:Apple domain-containing protein n=1 Tax=Fusarium redolens TaxID=48865 RepID=A0A9P9KE95_FUSRE|nr:uncharacterized protein BKA55DRAFT_562370 [Fusarium redolens]KAH7259317.1 hypothetical protein BKA55DRAFT_562370 [Fusarium redolens]